ncbi:nonsense-mediated mRNA decay factor SMG7-like [Euphorbia lathyris]|uniref:nonsense-mediated mRNA decay factor SMG7-like n=1 Tax=Euphorbia lathyris TaxID=212925 RepID=UPI003313C420
MDVNSLPPLKDQKEKSRILIEVANVEKQLWALILTKGILHSDVQPLYRKVCSSYEKIILNGHELVELQDIEYSLWKVHYRHIDEFRKRIKKIPVNEEGTKFVASESVVATQRSNDIHVKGYKSFLSEAIKYYQNLIIKIKRYYGFSEDFSFCKRGENSVSVEAKTMQKLQFLCHRFLVCLGDLARYTEQCEKSDVQNQNWSVAVTHYLEATKIWPQSGNPQNQLAVLATYVGDEFLALYHCIRSLAVREPFPDARNNLMLLFERNRSSSLQFLSSEACFDFLNPSESATGANSQSRNDLSNCKMVQAEQNGSRETTLWPLLIRTMSFFFMKSSLEDFPSTFACTIKELDMLMALDDEKLKAAMESYKQVDSARSGPFRTLQVVSIFIFVIEDLINCPERRGSKNENDGQQFELTQEALTAAFIFMGRLVDRCLKAKFLSFCPLLPALLVFSEWLVSILDEAETYGSNEKSTKAMLYFFGAFLELLTRFDINKSEAKPSGSIALWEDYELRGFAPLACSHLCLDFSIHWEHADNYESGAECRAHRIVNAAIKIADRANSNNKWIRYDKSERKFYTAEANNFLRGKETEGAEPRITVLEVKDSGQHVHKMIEESEKIEASNSRATSKPVVVEEEEVILFKPLTRYNSAPLYNAMKANGESTHEDTADHAVTADECLRRATSLLIAQNQAQGDASSFQSDMTNFRRNQQFQKQEPLVKDDTEEPYSEASVSSGPFSFNTNASAGPPSLNAWVLSRGSLSIDKIVKGRRDVYKHGMPPIEEISTALLNDLSISVAANSVVTSGHESVITHDTHHAYTAPMPSAPFLPDDAVWFNGNQSTFSNYNGSGNTNITNNVFDASQAGGYANWTVSHQPIDYGLGITNFTDGYPPTRRLTSSEWLRQYRETQNLDRIPSHVWPEHSYGAVNTGNLYGHDMSRSGLFDQFGAPLAASPLVYEEYPLLIPGFPPVYGNGNVEQRREKLYHGYQRPSPYGCGAVNEPEPLLQYLKEKEWLLQQDPTFQGPAYTGS